MTGPVLRLLADDLTGALDSAARFVPLVGVAPTIWAGAVPAGSAAIDSGTRDADEAAALAAMARWAPALGPATIAFKKVDSLLRGHVAPELATCMGGFDRCVLAPAFPFQGRITRGGRQWVRGADGWRAVGPDPATLPVPLREAETDADLDRIVAAERARPGRVLWCGSGGLAGALAERRTVPCPDLPRPILALIGSDHPVTRTQLAVLGPLHHRLAPDADRTIHGSAAVSVALPPGLARDQALHAITATFRALLARGPRPGTLFVTGGETLRALCDALGATRLDVDGEIEPGVPASVMRGGIQDGLRIVSRSGAFGDAGFLLRLLSSAPAV